MVNKFDLICDKIAKMFTKKMPGKFLIMTVPSHHCHISHFFDRVSLIVYFIQNSLVSAQNTQTN